jgi:hypothetical protein
MLRLNKLYLLIGWAISCLLFFEVAAHADERDESTKMTFSQPVQIPGRTLPAGTYLFKLVNSENDRNVVQVFNADGTKLYTTVMAIPTTRREISGDTVLIMAQEPQGDALLKWFYPGREDGQEFVYPKQQETQLAQDQQHTLVVNENGSESGD